jgi:predicted metallopeptidase
MDFEHAPDVERIIENMLKLNMFSHVRQKSIYCVRSVGSKARAYARIWGLSRIFQFAAGYRPTYVIEVLSRYFDKLNEKEKIKVLIHELMHIPKTFSGALLSHRGRFHRINNREVEKMYENYLKSKKV